jgi:hypothetical protein
MRKINSHRPWGFYTRRAYTWLLSLPLPPLLPHCQWRPQCRDRSEAIIKKKTFSFTKHQTSCNILLSYKTNEVTQFSNLWEMSALPSLWSAVSVSVSESLHGKYESESWWDSCYFLWLKATRGWDKENRVSLTAEDLLRKHHAQGRKRSIQECMCH